MTGVQRLGAALPATVQGCVQAVVGLFAKPLAGLLDTIAQTSFSFQDVALAYLGAHAKDASVLRQRWQRVRPPRPFGPDKALKELVLKQSHASLLLSKVERGRFAYAGALDLLELSGGAQLIITPLMLICVDPQHTRQAMWTVPMHHVLSAQIASTEERKSLSEQLERALNAMGEDHEDGYDSLLGDGVLTGEGVLVIITCIRTPTAQGYEVSLGGSNHSGVYRSDGARQLRVVQSGAFLSHLVLCASMRAARRLQRTVAECFDLYQV